MKKCLLFLILAICFAGCKEKTEKMGDATANTEMEETEMEKNKEGKWIVLFDGSSMNGWKAYNGEGVPEAWTIEDGAMVLNPPKTRPEGANYNLVTENEYKDFVLSLEWRISEGGNSGIMWGISEDKKFSEPYETGPEIQVLDNDKHPDAKNGTTHQAGSLYDMVAPSVDNTKEIGEWNTCIITVDHKSEAGSVVLNGEEVVTFPLGNDMWDVMVSKSKFADWENFGKFSTGKIGLQDHGDQVAFRNIKIKEL